MAKAEIPRLKNWKEVEEAVGTIGDQEREIGKLTSKFEAKVDKLKATLVAPADELRNEKVALERAVEEFVLEHREEFEGSTRCFSTGEVQVAKTPASIVCFEGDDETIKRIKKKGLERQFLRVKESVNKTAIRDAKLSDRDLSGLKVRMESKDRVTIKPLGQKLTKSLPGAA